MERIRKALEQAEQDRSKRKENTGATPIESGASVSSEASESSPAQDIAFKRTRILEVSNETLENNRVVAAIPGHALTDVYRILRTQVLQEMDRNGWNTLAITSPATGAGKTLTAINLAVSLAREVGRTVLLADFDLRHPSIHSYFDYEPEYGLSDYLFHDAPLEKILFSPTVDRLVVLPGRESIPNSSEMLRSPKMVQLVQELKDRYSNRLVIFDLPPVLAIDDALAFRPYTDALLMVAENGATRKGDLEDALELLKGTPIIGTVLNKAQRVSVPVYSRS
jgi:protein-tyrosine kinase